MYGRADPKTPVGASAMAKEYFRSRAKTLFGRQLNSPHSRPPAWAYVTMCLVVTVVSCVGVYRWQNYRERQTIVAAIKAGWTVWISAPDGGSELIGLNRRTFKTSQAFVAAHWQCACGMISIEPGKSSDDVGGVEWRNLPHLRVILAADTRLLDNDLEGISAIRTLRVLDLSGTGITDSAINAFSTIQSLESVFLNDTSIGDGGVALLSKLPELKSIGIGGTEVSDITVKMLSQMTCLRNVNLARTKLSDACISDLGHMKWLHTLDIRGTPISPEGVQKIIAALPQTQVLVCSSWADWE